MNQIHHIGGKVSTKFAIARRSRTMKTGTMSVHSNRIRQERTKRGLTQAELADRCNTTNQQISRLEAGQRELTQSWLERLARALDINPVRLLPAEMTELNLDAYRAPEVNTPGFSAPYQPGLHITPTSVRLLPASEGLSPDWCAWFGKEFLDRYDLDRDLCQAVVIYDSSMMPTLPPGSAVLIDRGRTELYDNAFYYAEFKEEYFIRRARRVGNSWYLSPEDLEKPFLFCDETLRILGQLIWIGRLLIDPVDDPD